MMAWRSLGGERTDLYSPIGLRPVDEITGAAPLGEVRVDLDIKNGNGGWQMTNIKPVITPGGVITFPGLERRAEVAGQPPRHYRIRLDAELYRPVYPAGTEGYEFDGFPYNDDNPPQKIVSQVQDAFLTPATNYPFPTHIYVLYGDVRDATNSKVVDALVTEGAKERVLTDERGAFALPLRLVQKNVPTSINAEDQRTGRTGTITVIIPADLGKNHIITIS